MLHRSSSRYRLVVASATPKTVPSTAQKTSGAISEFIDRHYRHFNAAVLKDAADAYIAHLDAGGKMMITLAGAMSTAELGVSLAEMIRQNKVHAITCTGANLEEDLFNLVARSQYERIPNYRELSPQAEEDLLQRHLNRVTDTCIPEDYAIRKIEKVVIEEWMAAGDKKESVLSAPVSFQDSARMPSEEILRDRSRGQLDDGCGANRSARLRARLGRFHARKYFRRP